MCRRGYSVAAVVVKGTGRMVVEKVAKRVMGKEAMNTAAAAAPAEKAPWVPDPVTGYYRPAGAAAKEADAVDLRAKLLPQRVAN